MMRRVFVDDGYVISDSFFQFVAEFVDNLGQALRIIEEGDLHDQEYITAADRHTLFFFCSRKALTGPFSYR